jgi:hypothetical protein
MGEQFAITTARHTLVPHPTLVLLKINLALVNCDLIRFSMNGLLWQRIVKVASSCHRKSSALYAPHVLIY